MSPIYLQIVSMAFLIIFVGISKVRILAIVIAIIIMINKTSIKSTKPDKPKNRILDVIVVVTGKEWPLMIERLLLHY